MLEATSDWLAQSRERTGADWQNIVAEESRSPTVSTVRLPEGVNGKTFVQRCQEAGYSGWRRLRQAC